MLKINTLCPSFLRFFSNSKAKVILLENLIVSSYKLSRWALSILLKTSANLNFANNDFTFAFYCKVCGLTMIYSCCFFYFFNPHSAVASRSTGRSLTGVVSTSKASHYRFCFLFSTLFELRVRHPWISAKRSFSSYYCSKAYSSSSERRPNSCLFWMLVAARSCGWRHSFFIYDKMKNAFFITLS